MTTKTRDQIIEDIIQFFKDDSDTFADCIEELDDATGILGRDRWHPMEEIEDYFDGYTVLQLLDIGANTPDFDPYANYFRTGGGVVETTNNRTYHMYLNATNVMKMVDNLSYIKTLNDPENNDLAELFDELEEMGE